MKDNSKERPNVPVLILSLILVPIFALVITSLLNPEITDNLASTKWVLPVIVFIGLLILLKIIFSFLLWSVKINNKENYICFRTLTKSHIFTEDNISEWGIRIVAARTDLNKHFFECKKSDGSVFIYPLSRKYNYIEIKGFLSQVTTILNKASTKYRKYSVFNESLKRIKYDFWYLLSF